MSFSNMYNKIVKYRLTATCTQPLHIGSPSGNPEEVLVHPVDGIPFIQASSIAGVFRSYYKDAFGEENADRLFGASKFEDNMNASAMGSLVKFSDGRFISDKKEMHIELRPRVSINPVTGTCDASTVKGTDRKAGHKFNMSYIGAGAQFVFDVYLFDETNRKKLEDVFAAIHHQVLQFGGQKSNGCGYMKIDRLLCKEFDMKETADRKLWFSEDTLEDKFYMDLSAVLKNETKVKNAYEILVDGNTEGQMLVKSIAVSDYEKGSPDCMNIQNSAEEYIVPGSSFKGAIRNQAQMIVSYLQGQGICDGDIITEAFGKSGTKEQDGKTGNLCFFDTVVGNKEENDNMPLSHRIHIDKFTGGVMHGGLFSEKNISGNMRFEIHIRDRNTPDRTCGILLLALRDLAAGAMSIGSGYNIGKGIITVEKIHIFQKKDQKSAEIDYRNKKIKDEDGVIKNCMQAVYGGNK